MEKLRALEERFTSLLKLVRRPVAVAIRDEAPSGINAFQGTVPSGCSFWRLAAAGDVFYTVPSDHYNCPIGAHTHNIPMPEERSGELLGTLGLMTKIGYLRMEEVPGIPQLADTPGAVIYAPLGDSPIEPDVVLFTGNARQIMLLNEAMARARIESSLPTLGRPTCMSIPAAIARGAVTSTGCIGNRIYTDIEDDQLYIAVSGANLERVAGELGTITAANAKLTDYHRERRQSLSTV